MIRLCDRRAAASSSRRRCRRAERPVERGNYLVNTIMTCQNCHTPKGRAAAVFGSDFSGGFPGTSRRSR